MDEGLGVEPRVDDGLVEADVVVGRFVDEGAAAPLDGRMVEDGTPVPGRIEAEEESVVAEDTTTADGTMEDAAAMTELVASVTRVVAFGAAVEFPVPDPRAKIFAAAVSAATMTIACVFPGGKSGCIEASTTKRLSVS